MLLDFYFQEQTCETKGGYGPCVFPFKYRGQKYEACTTAGNYKPWCAYKVDAKGIMVAGKWAYCVGGKFCQLG